MANEISESKSILRQLLLSSDESDSSDISERKRKMNDDSEKFEKRGRTVYDNFKTGRTMAEQMADEQPATTVSASRPSTLPLSNPLYYRAPPPNWYLSFQAGYEQHRKRMREITYLYQLEMLRNGYQLELLGNGPSNNLSPFPQQPKEDDLPVTHEMQLHYLEQLHERLTQDAIGLPS